MQTLLFAAPLQCIASAGAEARVQQAAPGEAAYNLTLEPLPLNPSVGPGALPSSYCYVQGRPAEHASTYPPRLWFVAAEDLIGSQQIQLAMALLEHVDPRKSPG